MTGGRVGLPDGVSACLFDLDGVLTSTARQHEAAWRTTFDEVLSVHCGAKEPAFSPGDYTAYVDGRPRADGVRTFLASRGLTLPEGQPDDPPGTDTVNAVGNKKNLLVLRIIDEQGVRTYPGSVRYLHAARDAGVRVGVVTSSANGAQVLDVAGLTPFVEIRIDGLVLAERKLRGKPAPDSFLAGAADLGVPPERVAVFEDALAGVRAGRAGGFGFVVGVDRANQADALREQGADVVVTDLADLITGETER